MDAVKIAKKDLKSLTKEKTIVLAIMLLISISSLSQIIAFGLTVLYSPSVHTEIRIGLVGSGIVFERVANPIHFKNLEKALLSLKKGEIDVVVVLKENSSGINYIDVYIPREEFKAVKIMPSLRDVMMKYQDELRKCMGIPVLSLRTLDSEGRYLNIPEGISIQFRVIYTVLIPLLAILTAIIVGVYVIDIFCEEIEKDTIELLLCCVNVRDIVFGKMLAVFIVSIILTVVWIIGLLLNGVMINVSLTILSSFIFYLMVVSLALLTVNFSIRREKSQLVFSLIIIPLILSFLAFNPSPLSLIVKSSLSIFDSSVLIFAIVDVILFSLALKTSKNVYNV